MKPVFVLTLFSMMVASIAFADDAGFEAAAQTCKTQLSITGDFRSLTQDQRDSFKSCMEAQGFTAPPRGGRGHGGHGPSEAQRAAMEQCLQNQGITLPHLGPGVRPTLDATTQAAMETCRQQLESASGSSSTDSSSDAPAVTGLSTRAAHRPAVD